MERLENDRARLVLKKGRARSVNNQHPWIFSGAVDYIQGDWEAGDIISVYSFDEKFQGKGFYNPYSQIRMRVLTVKDVPITKEFFRRRILAALEFREARRPVQTSAYRLFHSDADGISGLIVDRYDQALVLQAYSSGVERLKPVILEILEELLEPEVIVERSDGSSRQEERLEPLRKVWRGKALQRLQICEYGVKFWVDILEGQKTGFFLDQRENRRRIAELAAGKRLLNCFSYTGGFSVHAALKGATTTSVELNEGAQILARENFKLNGLNPNRHRFEVANVFDFLRVSDETYDVIVLDPPAFVKKKSHLLKGTRGYKDINRLAMKKIKNEGLLLTCSCSHHAPWDLFQKIIFSAALEAGRQVQIIGRYGQPFDHPVNVFHPEGEYLKSFLLRVFD